MLVTMSMFVKKAWVWMKRNWKFLIGLTIPLLIGLLARRHFNYSEIIGRINEDYEKEINVINESHRIEKEKKELANKRYNDIVVEIEKRYAEEEKELTLTKKREVKKVIEENANDPDEITRRLSEITGFQIHTS